MKYVSKLQEAARQIKQDVMTVYFAARDRRTPILVRLLALAIAAYAISPIDLIPDFIPVVGYLDDVILLPLGILLVIKLTPKDVIEASRIRASRTRASEVAVKPTSTVAAVVIVVIWVVCAVCFGYWLSDTYASNKLLHSEKLLATLQFSGEQSVSHQRRKDARTLFSTCAI